VRELNGRRPIPELPRLAAELDRRLAEVGHMLGGHRPTGAPASVSLNVDETEGASLSQLHPAAVLGYPRPLPEIDPLTPALFEIVADIGNFSRANVAPVWAAAPFLPSALDPGRLAVVARWLAGFWLALLISIYVPDVPQAADFIALTAAILMGLCVMPQ